MASSKGKVMLTLDEESSRILHEFNQSAANILTANTRLVDTEARLANVETVLLSVDLRGTQSELRSYIDRIARHTFGINYTAFKAQMDKGAHPWKME